MITVQFGSMSLMFDGKVWWLVCDGDEAMEISEVEMEDMLRTYYSGSF